MKSQSCGGRWFVVLPDCEAASAVASQVASYACRTVPHASGRPWLLGCWTDDQAVSARVRTTRLVVVGRSSLTAGELDVRGKAVRDVADVEPVAAGAAGSFWLLASVDGQVCARGTHAGDRRLYRAEVDGVTVAADRARTLAWLSGARPDPARLAARLAVPGLPDSLGQEAMWPGVRSVAPGEALRLPRSGRGYTSRWWRPPPADLPLAEAAVGLREALRAAVAARVRSGRVLGADLSGGLDSTSLCFLAAEAGARLAAVTIEWTAPGNEDGHYARLAAARLSGITHLVFPSNTLPAHLSGLGDQRQPADQPGEPRDQAARRQLAGVLREHGAQQRLSGHGGDHVLTPPPAYLHALLRRHPLIGLRHTAAHRARGRWDLAGTARQLLSRSTQAQWLARQADNLDVGPRTRAGADWGPALQLPSWATTQARELLAGLLRQAAGSGARPLAEDRGRHSWIHLGRLAGTSAGMIEEEDDAAGLSTQMPFCDDSVIDACLRVRPSDAGHPTAYKPLLTAAMHGVVPADILARTTKDHCNPEFYAGLAAQRSLLVNWADSSHLAATGLADPGVLRRALLCPGLLSRSDDHGLDITLGIEAWLRDLQAHPHPSYLKEHSRESSECRPAAAS